MEDAILFGILGQCQAHWLDDNIEPKEWDVGATSYQILYETFRHNQDHWVDDNQEPKKGDVGVTSYWDTTYDTMERGMIKMQSIPLIE